MNMLICGKTDGRGCCFDLYFKKKKRRKKRGRMELMSVLTLLNLLTKFSREYCDEKYH
jgi:predicted nucleic acid-binding Zn ribbon protein